MKGLFITFEGCEGCGKSTVSRKVFDILTEHGFDVVMTREPGGTPVGEQIREILLNPSNKIADTTEALLFAAARAQHHEEKIIPAINKGTIVLCDRWLGSSLAYQGWARSLGVPNIQQINDFGVRGFRPDIQFFLDVTPEEGFKRISSRPGGADRIEKASLNFHKDVYHYFDWEASNTAYVKRINGMRDPDIIANEIVKDILEAIHK